MATHKITEAFIRERMGERSDRHRIFYANNKKAPPGFGVRVTKAGGASFVLNYYAGGAERRATIGRFGRGDGLSVEAAITKANALRARINAGTDPLLEQRQSKAAAVKAAEAAKARAAHTLEGLVAAYVGDLRAQGKPSAREVENLFARAVQTPFPKLAALPVDLVDVDAVMPALHGLTKNGKYRDAEKLATYLRTAFNTARTARTDARGHAYAAFNIRSNPLVDLRVSRPKATADAARAIKEARKWTLTQPQLAAYWKRIANMGDAYGAMMRLHLLTGGQRREQLARIQKADHDAKALTLRLWDGKGRRSDPREHVIPLLPQAQEALTLMAGDAGPYLFSTTCGASAATPAILDHAIARISTQMVEAKELPEGRTITPGAIRRTVETLLGDRGVSLEIRGQLQSHGLGTVQHRHYDMGEYLRHKREALETLRALCEPAPDNVTPMSGGKRAKRAA